MNDKTYCILEHGCDQTARCKTRCAAVILQPSNATSNHPDARMRLSLKKVDPCDPSEWVDGEKKGPLLSTGGKH